ncbi:MAG: type II toxin-antitoxin system VapC family toxin [Syntrophomonadaceae bacterium]|jgi:predicted nucleic acid-binding protein
MILVDTSVLIDFLKGQTNEKIQLFDEILSRNIDFGFSSYTFQEVLQGAQNEKEYEQLRDYLSTQIIYFLPEETATYEKAARLYFDLRCKGITPRSTIDVLIALTAIENNLLLLHNDHDFDLMAKQVKALNVLKLI